MLRIGRYTRSAASRRTALIGALVIVGGVAAVPGHAWASSPTVPDPPGGLVDAGRTGGVTVEWTAPDTDGGSPITGYEIAPVVNGAACVTCNGVENVASTTFTVDIPTMSEGVGNSFAVQAVNAVGASAWTYPSAPTPAPLSASIYPQVESGTTAATYPDNYSTPLNASLPPSSGYPNRIVPRDGGISAPLGSLGDLWVFDDTVVTDGQGTFPTLPPEENCFTANGTAAIEPSLATQPPALNEYLQQSCTPDGSTPVGTDTVNQPHQFLPSYWQGNTECRNWTNGATPSPTEDSAEISYGSECLPGNNHFSPLGTYVTSYTAKSNAAQPISATPAPQTSPVLPPLACPAANYSSPTGNDEPTGEYGSIVNYDGFYYFYNAYGNSLDIFGSEQNCSAMALARVPVAYVNTPGDYQYLVQQGGDTLWVSPSSTVPAATLGAESANVLPDNDFSGACCGGVSVGYVGGTTGLVMTYLLPASETGGSTTYVAALRTAQDPWGPWSAPVLYGIEGFTPITDYGLSFHPELSQNSTLELSWVQACYFAASNSCQFASPNQQVRFSTLPASILPPPPPGNEIGTVGLSLTPDRAGHWQTLSDGTVTHYGDAKPYGTRTGKPLNAPIVGMTDTKDGGGYWLVASDGGIFTYGDAPFYKSMGGKTLNAPMVGMASTPDGKGYWEVAADGGVFSFGDATFYGSKGGAPLSAPIVGMTTIGSAKGYVLLGADGEIYPFGPGAVDHGEPTGLTAPAVAVSAVSKAEYDVVTNNGTDYACTGTGPCKVSNT
jgi:hypothetical protein